MTAIAFFPFSRPSSATASFVMDAKISAPPTSMTTCEVGAFVNVENGAGDLVAG